MQNLTNHLEEVHQKIGYRFDNVDLLYQAFTRSSYSTQYGRNTKYLSHIQHHIGFKILLVHLDSLYEHTEPKHCDEEYAEDCALIFLREVLLPIEEREQAKHA